MAEKGETLLQLVICAKKKTESVSPFLVLLACATAATQVEQLKETAAPLESSDEQTLAEVGRGFGSLEA